MDFASIPSAELRVMQEKIAAQLQKNEKKDLDNAMAQIYGIANSVGLSLDELIKRTKAPRKPSTNRKLYVNPANPDAQWNGIGPRPKWIKDALAAGVSLESLRTNG